MFLDRADEFVSAFFRFSKMQKKISGERNCA